MAPRAAERPARAAGDRRAEEELRPRGAALRPAVAGPARAGVRAALRRARRRRARQRGVQRAPPGCTWRCARSAWARATRSSRRRSRSWPRPTRSLYERARPVFADIDPVTLNLDPEAGARGGDRAHARAAAGPHLRLPGRPGGVRGDRACRSSRTPARRSAPSTPTGSPVGGRGHPAVFGFYANKQMTTGEGGMVTTADSRRQGAHRLRAQPGPRAGHGLARPRPARVQLPALGRRLRARARPARAPRRHARRPRARRRAGTARRWPGSRASGCPCEDAGGDRRGWFVFVVQVPRGRDRDARGPGAARARRRSPSPTCRRST